MARSKKPRVISFRVSEKEWLEICRAASKTDNTPHEWGRAAVIERLRTKEGMTVNELISFEQLTRIQYLVANGFQLLADEKLNGDEWHKLRLYAKEKIDVIAARALANLRSKVTSEIESTT